MAFSDETKLAVWNKAQVVSGNDPASWRKDQCGAWIGWAFYGNRDSQYGWEIDHITPVSKAVLTTSPTFVLYNGRTTLPDKMTACIA